MSGFDRSSCHGRIPLRAAERDHGHLDLGIDVPRVGLVDLFLERGHLFHQLIGIFLTELHRDFVELVEDLLFRALRGDVLEDRLALVELRLLRQVTDLYARRRIGLTIILGVLARHDAQQGRLTRAVDADHADLGIGQKGEMNVLEHLLAARIGLGQALHVVDVLLTGHGVRTLADLEWDLETADVGVGGPQDQGER